jgi:predicted adenine nucleotide alpha hydrolase (AANH) superfamily ATPase
LIKTCVEVHGEQHFKFVAFYHNTVLNFLKAKKRDQEKEEWCEKNNIKYISLAYNENEQEWKNKIRT